MENIYCPICQTNPTAKEAKKLYIKRTDETILVDCKRGCDPVEILKIVNPFSKEDFKKSVEFKIFREHTYRDKEGKPYAKKVYYTKDGNKSTYWQRLENNQWVTGLDGLKPSLYQLDKLKGKHDTVYIAEGEKDVDTLMSMGFVATSPPNGASGRWLASYTTSIFADKVVILIDNDKQGIKHGEKVRKAVSGFGMEAIVINPVIITGDLKDGGDISDVVQSLGLEATKNELLAVQERLFTASNVTSTTNEVTENLVKSAVDMKLADKDLLIPFDPQKYDLSQMGFGQCLADNIVNRFLAVNEWRGKWAEYKDGIWTQDVASNIEKFTTEVVQFWQKNNPFLGAVTETKAKQIKAVNSGASETERERLQKKIDQYEHDLKEYNKIIKKSQTYKGHKELINITSHYRNVTINDFDNNNNIIAAKNVTIDMDKGTVRKHKPTDLITKTINAEYNADVKFEKWDKFISDIMGNDPIASKYLQKVFGYMFSGKANLKKMFMLYGVTNAGKTLLLETISEVMGAYAQVGSTSIIMPKRVSSSDDTLLQHAAKYKGSRMLIFDETSKGARIDEDRVKLWTSGGSVPARKLYESPFDYIPQFTMFVSTNHKPNTSDSTLFESGRMNVIPFVRDFKKEGILDSTLKSQFLSDDGRSAILNWLLEGYKLFLVEGLDDVPESFQNATNDYEKDSNPVQQYVDEELVKITVSEGMDYKEAATQTWSAIYNHFRSWYKDNVSAFPPRKIQVKNDLIKLGITIKESTKHKNKMMVFGYCTPELHE